jgi:signal transduction histidine kinase
MFNKPRIKNVNRQSLIIFIVLAVVFVAQLVWWIVFHLGLIDQRYKDYLTYAQSRKIELASALYQEYQSARDLMLLNAENLNHGAIDSLTGVVESNRFVTRLIVTNGEHDTLLEYNSEKFEKTHAVDAGVRISKDGTIIAVALDYSIARELADAYQPRLEFIPPPQDSAFFHPIGGKNFQAHPDQISAYHEEMRASRIMLFSEGGFFIVLALVGLALIFRALSRSEESLQMQENFLMAVTHELRSPLASLRLSIEGLQRGKLSDTNRNKSMKMIDADLDRLGYLIDDLLEAGRSSGKTETGTESVALTLFTRNYFSAREEEFASRSISVTLKIPESGAELTAGISNGDLTRCVDIAVDNAIKFSDSDVRIEVTLAGDKDWAALSIRDQGIGLEKSESKRVFERFYRVGNELTRSRQGTGLGLYLAKRIIESSGGRVTIESAGLGAGATVTFMLRLQPQ